MSIQMNGYEQNLKNKLQRDLTKREAEEAILEIREALYGDSYTQIHPIYIGHNNTVSEKWPPSSPLVKAYYSGNYEQLDDFREVEDFEEEIKQELPNVSAIADSLGYQDVVQNNPHHFGTVYEHINAVIYALPNGASDNVRMAALLHDIGKFDTISVNPKTGYSQFIKHADKSVEIIDKNIDFLLPSENFSDDDREYVKELVRLHDTKYGKQGKCQTMLNEHSNGFAKDLITLQYADIMGQSSFNREAKLQEVMKFEELLLQVGTSEQTIGLDNIKAIIEKSICDEHQKNLNREEKEKEWLARTADNKDIFIDSDTIVHMEAHTDVNMTHIREAIGKISIGNVPFIMKSINMERTVGKDNCVEVSVNDRVENLYRKGRDGMTPIVMNKEPACTSLLTVGIALDDDGKLTMFTSFYGQLAPKEPWDKSLSSEERTESEQFWNTHALVLSDKAIDWERSDRKLS